MDGTNKIMPEEIPNSQAPTNGGDGQGQEAKPVMGTTPTSQQVQKPAPTSDEQKAEGTEGEEKKPDTAPNKEGEGEPAGEPDYKEKFSASSAEAQRLHKLLKDAGIDPTTGKPIEAPAEGEKPQEEQEQAPAEETVRAEQPSDLKPLTDEELAKTIPGFANMSEGEKLLVRDIKSTVKALAKMQEFMAELHDERQFGKDLKALTGKEEWKKIAELSEEFKEFAYKKENLKTPLETLAAAFLHTKGVATEKKPEKPDRTGLEGGGSGNGEEKDVRNKGYTADEAAHLRKSDPKKYAQLSREGKLKIREE